MYVKYTISIQKVLSLAILGYYFFRQKKCCRLIYWLFLVFSKNSMSSACLFCEMLFMKWAGSRVCLSLTKSASARWSNFWLWKHSVTADEQIYNWMIIVLCGTCTLTWPLSVIWRSQMWKLPISFFMVRDRHNYCYDDTTRKSISDLQNENLHTKIDLGWPYFMKVKIVCGV